MQNLKSAWKYFDGIKTKIGAALLFAAQVGPLIYTDPALWEIINKAGLWITGVGLAHTATKKAGVSV